MSTMLFVYSITHLLGGLISEPSLTILFGVFLILIASGIRRLNRPSTGKAQEQVIENSGKAETRLDTLADFKPQVPAAPMMKSVPQIQSD